VPHVNKVTAKTAIGQGLAGSEDLELPAPPSPAANSFRTIPISSSLSFRMFLIAGILFPIIGFCLQF
jgi:hypothetical protein